jgi:hypothetical protein
MQFPRVGTAGATRRESQRARIDLPDRLAHSHRIARSGAGSNRGRLPGHKPEAPARDSVSLAGASGLFQGPASRTGP